jgi:DinB superfamily
MQQDKLLRQQLAKSLDWNEAHADLSATVQDFPVKLRGKVPEGMPHSAWQLLEHIRIALWDILEFSRNAKHKSPKWPKGYWPAKAAPPSDTAWDKSLKSILESQEELRELVKDPAHDLLKPLPHGDGQTLLREVLLAADHGAYHLGQLVLVRKALGAWPG